LRLLDADILNYALYDESPFHDAALQYVKRGFAGEIELAVNPATALETYNVLYWRALALIVIFCWLGDKTVLSAR